MTDGLSSSWLRGLATGLRNGRANCGAGSPSHIPGHLSPSHAPGGISPAHSAGTHSPAHIPGHYSPPQLASHAASYAHAQPMMPPQPGSFPQQAHYVPSQNNGIPSGHHSPPHAPPGRSARRRRTRSGCRSLGQRRR
ncbi:hypothetical protein BD626DRAFT_150314 [Schizophyllum amplum]|uniref:Uncharacterized protein n=1 Tax=Schizophyllum amplum TaxID=97359 RepID=A0A550C404_9AGAR|nr:hypothetical protein BD626DRAFT_150314 [Auriculariopsis ampla]